MWPAALMAVALDRYQQPKLRLMTTADHDQASRMLYGVGDGTVTQAINHVKDLKEWDP